MKSKMPNDRTKLKNATNPEQAVRYLSERLRNTLALMRRGNEQFEPLILATLPRGSRLVLLALGAVEPAPENPSKLVLSAFGRDLSACCAITGVSPELQEKLTGLEQEQARRLVERSEVSLQDVDDQVAHESSDR